MKRKELDFIKSQPSELQPTVSSDFCWNLYFTNNMSKYHAARMALEKMGEDVVIQGQTLMLQRSIRKGLNLALDAPLGADVDTFIKQQTGRFVRALYRRIRLDEKEAA